MPELSRAARVGIVLVAIVGFALLLGSRSFVRFYRNTSAGMEPTLREGETLIVMTRSRPVGIGDIVVFRYPNRPETVFVKRAIAVGGNIVEIQNKRPSVNGRPVSEPYVLHEDATVYPNGNYLPEPFRSRDQFGPYTVPGGTIFALGDNRDRSYDSRYWGAVPANLVIGRVVATFSRRHCVQRVSH